MSGQGFQRTGWILALATLVLAMSLLAATSTGVGEASRTDDSRFPHDAHLITVETNSTEELWPYTSRRTSVDSATLPINMVVDHNAAFVRYLLSESTGARWNVTYYRSFQDSGNGTDPSASNENITDTPTATVTSASETGPDRPGGNGTKTGPSPSVLTGSANTTGTPPANATTTARNQSASRQIESGVVVNGTSIQWAEAHGSTRYTYVYDTAAERGRWIDETYQLHDGNYLGTRYHIRMYEGGTGENRWTAIQVHREHWDWFRLRHTVDSVDRAQDHLESEFRTSAFELDISRTWFANDGAIDSDGWVTNIDVLARSFQPMSLPGLGLVVVFVASALPGDIGVARVRTGLRRQLESQPGDLRHLLLLASLSLLVLGVRVGSIALEQAAAGVSPRVIAAVFYPLLVLGTPACAVLFSRGIEPGESALTAAVGFGAGIVADYAYMNIAVLPLDVVLHRTVLITTVGLFAAGSASKAKSPSAERGFWNGLLVIATLQWVVALLIPLFDLL